jgi:N4-gp56 family major capsid protein
MAYSVNVTGTAAVSNSIIELWAKKFEIALNQERIMDQFVDEVFQINAASILVPKMAAIPMNLTALSELDDATPVQLADSPILFTPAQYGTVVTKTELAQLQTGGMVNLQAAWAVGENMGRTMDGLALSALGQNTTVKVANGKTSTTLAVGDIANATFIEGMRNKLAKQNARKVNGMFVAILSDDVIADLQASAVAGSWTDTVKYTDPSQALTGEMGSYRGFRIVRQNLLDPTVGGQGVPAFQSSATVPVYTSFFLGANALGKAKSQDETIVFSGPFDRLSRFVNIGWKTTVAYKIVQSEAIVTGLCASSFSSN